MPQLIVEVKDKIARGNKERIVCGNSDYTIKFEFDEMWDAYPTKTALYKWGEEFKESERVPFEGDVCRVPKMLNTSGFKVGVYAGDLCSTTPAYFGADQSILCNTTEQDPPAPDIYNEIMELINKKAGGDPTLIRKVFTDVVESGELIYNWAVIPSKYIFRDVVIGGTPDEPGEDVIVTPEQMPVYGEDLIIEIEGTPYQARWLSENAIDNGGGDAWVSLNDDDTVTVGGMIGNWVVSLYKASDISPVIIPRDHIPEEQDPTVEDWAKKQEVKYVFRDIHLPSGVYSTVITPEVMPTYGDELIICAEGLFDAKKATWLSETTIDNGGGDLTAYIHEDGTMTISSMLDGVTAYLYYPAEKSVVPANRLPIATNDSLGAVKPVSRENNMSQPVGVGIDGRLWTIGYTLPVAEVATLGGVKPVTATAEMTQPVGVDAAGALYTAPGASGGGGVTSWNDLTDKPFGEEKVVSRNTIFDRTVEVGVMYTLPYSLSRYLNQTVFVTLDSTVYETTVIFNGEGGSYRAYLGDTGICIAENVTDPKVIRLVRASTNEQHTLKIEVVDEETTIKTIDPKYLPDTIATKSDIEAAIGNAIGGSY